MSKMSLNELFGSEDNDTEESEDVTIIDNPIDDPGEPEESDQDAEEGEPQDAEEGEPEKAAKKKASKKKASKKKAAKKKAPPPPEPDEEEEEEEEEGEKETSLTTSGTSTPTRKTQSKNLKVVSKDIGTGLVAASWGAKVARTPIEKYRGSTGGKDLVNIPLLNHPKTDEPMLFVSKRHYSDETGGFYCFDSECCDHLGLPDVRYNIPIVCFDTDRKGNLASAEFEIMFLQCPESRYDEFLTYLERGQDLTDMDFILTCEDEEFQRIKVAGFAGATWRKNKEFAKTILNELVKAWSFAPQVIANKMTRERFLEKVGVADTGDAPPNEKFDLDNFLKG